MRTSDTAADDIGPDNVDPTETARTAGALDRAAEALYTNPRTDPRRVTMAQAQRTLTTDAEIDEYVLRWILLRLI